MSCKLSDLSLILFPIYSWGRICDDPKIGVNATILAGHPEIPWRRPWSCGECDRLRRLISSKLKNKGSNQGIGGETGILSLVGRHDSAPGWHLHFFSELRAMTDWP